MTNLHTLDFIIILIAIVATLATALFATKKRNDASGEEAVAGRSLGPVVLALSAGAAANSGFVLTGAVGLGYAYGLMWCLLPLGWLIGDVIFWLFLAQKINNLSRSSNTVTLSGLLSSHTDKRYAVTIRMVSSSILIILLSIYLSSQWLSAGKMANYIFDTDIVIFALLFGITVVAYTAFSGVRGAIYTDVTQSIFMLLFVIALIVQSYIVLSDETVSLSTSNLPENFLLLTGSLTWWQVPLFLLGFAAMSIGFNVGQPQMTMRWMAAKQDSIKKAKWIYITFVQSTFITFILLGILIRITMEGLDDPEQALFAFVKQASIPGFMGLLIASAISTIASTGSSIVATCGEMVRVDIFRQEKKKMILLLAIIVIAIISFMPIIFSDFNVFTLAITAVTFVASLFAASIIYILWFKKISAISFFMSIIGGLICSILWKLEGLSNIANEALPSIIISFLLILFFEHKHKTNQTKPQRKTK